MRFVAIALFVVLLVLPSPIAADPCVGLRAPVEGPVVAPFAPVGRYGGHWGIDIAAPEGSVVRAADGGQVTFSGSVVGRQAVTVDHGGGLRTTVSAVAERLVAAGQGVGRGMPIAVVGTHDGRAAVHVSVRVGSAYVDPADWLGCRPVSIPTALRLVPVP